jgi:exopolysaccharide biosynthesis polyprenyl glycosylphosphotransferase
MAEKQGSMTYQPARRPGGQPVVENPSEPPQTVPGRVRPALLGERLQLMAIDAVLVVAVTTSSRSWSTSLTAGCWTVAALAVAGLYRPRLRLSAVDDLSRLVLAVGIASAVYAWVAPLVAAPRAMPGSALWWWLVVAACLLLGRLLGYVVIRQNRSRSPGERALIVGTGPIAARLAEALQARPEYGLRPVGFVGPAPTDQTPGLPQPLLGGVGELATIAGKHEVGDVIVAFPASPDSELVPALRSCRQQGRTVFVVPRLFELNVRCLATELVEGLPLVRMSAPAPRRRDWPVKRLLDLAIATLCVVVLAPVLLVCALAVRWETGPGILLRQQRVGQDGRRFTMLKFRTLTAASQLESDTCWSISRDCRLGPVGRLLRRTSLDELPQLFNVLRGDMSLVGPRPERPFFVEQFGARHRRYADRHRAPSGMTGWAQIHGLRGDTSIEDRVSFDNYYIENWTLGLDLKILARTLAAIFGSRRG